MISVSGSNTFYIKIFIPTHSCMGLNHNVHAQATVTFLMECIQDKISEQPKYLPIDIIFDIRRELGIKISYSKAYQAKERDLENNHRTHHHAYVRLPSYCDNILKTNPNNTAIYKIYSKTQKVSGVFMSFGASVMGLVFCQLIIRLDGTHLKHKYRGILLTATSVDFNACLFPVVDAIVNQENDEN